MYQFGWECLYEEEYQESICCNTIVIAIDEGAHIDIAFIKSFENGIYVSIHISTDLYINAILYCNVNSCSLCRPIMEQMVLT